MGALLESGLVGNIGLKHLKVIKEDTINKWNKLGFLDGLKGHLKENMAQLYENQASHLINEATGEGSNGAFETVVFPIVRRVFSKLLANDIVSVQAMNLPIGKLFYFVPKIQGYQNEYQGPDATGGIHYPPVGAPNGPANGAGYEPTGPYAYKKWIHKDYLTTLKVSGPQLLQLQQSKHGLVQHLLTQLSTEVLLQVEHKFQQVT
jgi:hypothetical protein